MGTRHLQSVIDKDGNLKIAQYGQWDGYPDGQGKDILEFLRHRMKNDRLATYQNELSKIPIATKEQLEECNKHEDWKKKWPYMSRDCGSDIHQMIQDGEVRFVNHCSQDEANSWCEGFYTIDFQKRTFTSVYHDKKSEYSLDKLPTVKAYLKKMTDEETE